MILIITRCVCAKFSSTQVTTRTTSTTTSQYSGTLTFFYQTGVRSFPCFREAVSHLHWPCWDLLMLKWIVGFVKVVTWISPSWNLDMWKLIHGLLLGFINFDTWIFLIWYMDLSKLMQYLTKMKIVLSFSFKIKVLLNESKHSVCWVCCALCLFI